MSNVHLVGALEFASPARRKEGLAAFEEGRYTEFTSLEDWVEDGKRGLRIDASWEVEADCIDHYHEAFTALARSAKRGRVDLRWDSREGYWGAVFAGGHYLEVNPPPPPGPLLSFSPERLMRAYTEWPGKVAERRKTDIRLLAAAESPDGALLAAAGGPPEKPFARTVSLDRYKVRAHWGVAVFDEATGEERWRSFAANDAVFALAFSPDGARLAAAGNDGNLYLLDVKTGEVLHTERKVLAGGAIALAFSPDGELIAVGGLTKKIGRARTLHTQTVKILRLSDYKLLKEYGKLHSLFALVFSADSKSLTAWSTVAPGVRPRSTVYAVKSGASKDPTPLPDDHWDMRDGVLTRKKEPPKSR